MKAILMTSTALLLSTAAAFAGQPDNPGQFGKDRAAGVKAFQADGTEPGASEWGKIAGTRAGENGEINRAYKDAVGGSPNPANDEGSGND